MAETLLGAIEGGGTKFACAVGRAPNTLLAIETIATSEPGPTLGKCVEFFAQAQRDFGPLAAIGFGCFGPLDLRSRSPSFGQLLRTPKPSWSGVDLIAPFLRQFRIPVALDTDVTAAALAEWRLGAPDCSSLAYVTVGTGIGGGVAPRAHSQWLHAEMGHLRVRRDSRDLTFSGSCPFHGDCLEGLASGVAIRARWGRDLHDLPPEHEARQIISGYLGQLAAAIALMVPVERIVIGGGVAHDNNLLPGIRRDACESLNGYLVPLSKTAFETYICAPTLGGHAGLLGGLLLADQLLAEQGTGNHA